MSRKRSSSIALLAAAALVGRQGDVAIFRVNSLPTGALKERLRERGRVVLAHGEVTGHAHAIADKKVIQYDAPNATEAARMLFRDVGLETEITEHNAPSFLAVEEPATIEHEEHSPIALEPGSYVVLRQREWSDTDEPRQVAD